VGLGQLLDFVPGAGRAAGALSIGLFRNFNREAAAKFMFYAAAPVLAMRAFSDLEALDFSASSPMPDLSWFTLAVSFVVSIFASLMAIDALMKQAQKKGNGGYALYRVALAIAICVVAWLRTSDLTLQ
jgi:undecaprenyl-diphosphatase